MTTTQSAASLTVTLRAPALSAITTAPAGDIAVATVLGLVPRAPKLPSDISILAAVDPMSATLAHVGGLEFVAAARANVIRGMIRSALAEAAAAA